MSNEIAVKKTMSLKTKPEDSELVFGEVFTDHMFVMDYSPDKGWHNPRIEPYGPFYLDPSTMVFHYGQAIFEGIKAYKGINGKILLFRPQKYISRLNSSARRLCIPEVEPELILSAIKKLINIDRDWVPSNRGTALYIRPAIIATDPYLGVRPSHTYIFFIILSPVGAYYTEGFKPVRILVTDKYVRAVPGGVGAAKTPGNYAASLLAAEEARKMGYTQVLWLDGVHHKFVEEVGTMNIFFRIGDEVITPPLEGTILAGVTRDSVLILLKEWGIAVSERRISIDEVFAAGERDSLLEVFGTGTAAVISPVSELSYKDRTITINDGQVGELSKRLFEEIVSLQYGEKKDPFGWIVEID
ncbi:MAG: branched-chain amino acid aminotransferase [Nitrospirae bacterium]|nr:branched-chain amino acid aminotransferase [Nitrospirota bacterium]